MAADCKSADFVYGGSNPSPCTFCRHGAGVAHILGKNEVAGSNPAGGFFSMELFGWFSVGKVSFTGIAQLVEHWSPKPRVASSSLAAGVSSQKLSPQAKSQLAGAFLRVGEA